MIYSVEINFRKGPSFTVSEINAESDDAAKERALNYARRSGFNAAVKKVTVRKQ